MHPLDPHLVGYRVYGKGHTLPSFWAVCDACEQRYQAGDDEALVQAMLAADVNGLCESAQDIDELVRKPVNVFRRADLGARRLSN